MPLRERGRTMAKMIKKEAVVRKVNKQEVPYTLHYLTDAKTGCRCLDAQAMIVEVVSTETRPETKQDFKIRRVYDFAGVDMADILANAAENIQIRVERKHGKLPLCKVLADFEGYPTELKVQGILDEKPEGGRGRTAKTPTQRADDALAKMGALELQKWMIGNGFYTKKNFQAVAETKGIEIPEDFNY